MELLGQPFNNREISTMIWLLLALLWSLRHKNIRSSLIDLIKAFFKIKIIVSILAMVIYVAIIIQFLIKSNFWEVSMFKDTTWWFIGIGFVTLIEAVTKQGKKDFFKKLLLDSIKLVIILEFIVNLYSFSLITELFFVPIVTFLAMTLGYAQVKSEHAAAERILESVLSIIGVGLIVYAGHSIFQNYPNLDTIGNLRNFLLPIILTFAFIPFFYLSALVSAYEQVLIRIDLFGHHSENKAEAKRNLILLCNINLWRLNSITEGIDILNVKTKKDIAELIDSRRKQRV